MKNQLRIEVSAPMLNDEGRARLTQALKERIAQSPDLLGKIAITDATRPAAPGERVVGSIITGVMLVKAGDFVGEIALGAIKKAIEEVTEKFVAQQFERIMVRIFDRDGKLEFRFESKPQVEAANGKPHKYAILIANQVYGEHSGIKNLRYCINDVDRVRDALLLCPDEYTKDSIVVLKDQNHWEIELELDRMLKRARNDFLLIYYSGHGLPHPITNKLYLTARNTMANQLAATALDYEKITSYIKENFARKVGVILDCCYAGMAKEGFRGDPRDSMHAANSALDQSGRSFAVITASSTTQLAKEEGGGGVVTDIIVHGIETGEAGSQPGGKVTFPGLFDYIRTKIPESTYQTPDYAQVGEELVLVNTGQKQEAFREELKQVRDKLRTKVDLIGERTYRKARAYMIFLGYFEEGRHDARYRAIADFVSEGGGEASFLVRAFEFELLRKYPGNLSLLEEAKAALRIK